jgi:uncharacterized membrane protein
MMELWALAALVVALVALRRALRADRNLRHTRAQLAAIESRLAALEGPARPAEGATAPAADPPPAARPDDIAAIAPAHLTTILPPAEGHLEEAASRPQRASGPGAADVVPPLPAPPAFEPGTSAWPPRAPERAQPATSDADSLEAQIGSRWLLYLGIGTLVLGLSYFVKFAFDNEWIAPPVRVGLGVAAGAVLIAAGLRFAARGLTHFGQVLTGGGIGTLFLAIFAAHHWYGLLDRAPAFVAMVAVTLAGALLADRQRSQPLAMLSVLVGFLVPFLVGGQPGSQVTLFTYDLILACGTLYLARRREWPALNLVSYLLTVFTMLAWAERSYDRREYWITQIFLTAFLALFLRVRYEGRHAQGPVASLASMALALAPVFYHLASLAVLRPHRGALFVYLIGFSVAGTIAAGQLRLPWVRLLVWLGTAAPCLDIAAGRVAPGWLPGAWITIVAIFGVHVIAQVQSLDDHRPDMPVPEIALLHGNGLWMLACLWALVSPRSIVSVPNLVLGLAGLYAALAWLGRRWHVEAALHATALAAMLLAAAVALKFSGPWLIVSFAAEGAALAWLGLRAGRGWVRAGGLALLFVATLLAADRLSSPASVSAWAIVNPRTLASLFVVAMLAVTAAVHWRQDAAVHGGTIAILVVVANLLVVAVLSSEIAAYYAARAWALGEQPGGGRAATTLAYQLTLSLAWAAYAVMLVAAGLRWRYRPVRYLAIALFGVTMAKVFFVDLARLDRVYRMLSVIGLGLLLLVASYMYQRLRTQADAVPERPDNAPPDAATAGDAAVPTSHDSSIAP